MPLLRTHVNYVHSMQHLNSVDCALQLFLIGTRDQFASSESQKIEVDKAQAAGNAVEIGVLEGCDHFQPLVPGSAAFDRVQAWINTHF